MLWIMGLLSAAMGVLVMRATHETRLGSMPPALMHERAAAEAAVWQAASLLHADDAAVDHLGERWATGVDPDTQQQELGRVDVDEASFAVGSMVDGAFHPGLVDEERKLNLNRAPTEQIVHLITEVGPPDAPAQALAAAIADWRDEPVGEPCASVVPACHHAPFETVDELRAVPGMTPEIFASLAPYVTVYGSGLVNVNTASAAVLNAVGAPGSAWVRRREQQPFATSPDPGNPWLTVASTHFTVPIESTATSISVVMRVDAVIDRQGHLLAWHPHTSGQVAQ